METIYSFSAYNSEAMYGFGTRDEAISFCDYLNNGKEINLYEYEETQKTHEGYKDIEENCCILLDEIRALEELGFFED